MTPPSSQRQTKTSLRFWRTALSAWLLDSLWFGKWKRYRISPSDISERFASVTVNLGPTFLSGALAANAGAVMDEPSCPLVQVRRGAIMERCHLSHSSPGSLQTLCSQCHLDIHQQPEYPADHLPPAQAVQGLHQDWQAGHQPPTGVHQSQQTLHCKQRYWHSGEKFLSLLITKATVFR